MSSAERTDPCRPIPLSSRARAVLRSEGDISATLKPAEANARAQLAPIPRPAPVTRATGLVFVELIIGHPPCALIEFPPASPARLPCRRPKTQRFVNRNITSKPQLRRPCPDLKHSFRGWRAKSSKRQPLPPS